MERDVRVALVGAGFWATEMHLPALQKLPGVRVVGVASRSEKSARSVAERFGIPRWTADYRELLADSEVDLVDVLTVNALHAPISIEAMRLGKHVICIKPIAIDLEQADLMLTVARERGVRLFYAENVPFIPAVQRAAAIAAEGGIGRVFRVKACEGIGAPHASWFFDPALSGGGAIIDMAVHSIAFCRVFAGAEVDSVYAETGVFVHHASAVEDTSVITLRFGNGVIGQCEDSWSLSGAMDSRFEVFGTQGRILIDNLHRQPVQVLSESGYSSSGDVNAGGKGWTFPLPLSGDIADGHVAMLGHFVECLRTGAQSEFEGEYGRAILAVAVAAMESARSGRREPVNHVGPKTR